MIRGNATQEQQFDILKESVANVANRLTTKLFGKAILTTPQARAAMLGFELGKAFGDRIAADLELVFQGTLVDDCTLNLVRVQGANGPADVRYNEPTIVTIDSDQYWHKGWTCTIVTSGYVDTIAGGVVQAQRPESSTATQSVVWQITTGGKRVVYWDPACAVARACSFAKS